MHFGCCACCGLPGCAVWWCCVIGVGVFAMWEEGKGLGERCTLSERGLLQFVALCVCLVVTAGEDGWPAVCLRWIVAVMWKCCCVSVVTVGKSKLTFCRLVVYGWEKSY